jgi:hypothetical protein
MQYVGIDCESCAMPRISLDRPDLKLDPDDPPGFRAGVWRFGESLGAEPVGTTLYELPPGQAVCPVWQACVSASPAPRGCARCATSPSPSGCWHPGSQPARGRVGGLRSETVWLK